MSDRLSLTGEVGAAGAAGAPRRRGLRRPLVLALLAVVVALLHLVVTHVVGDRIAAWGEAAAMPTRIDVAYVRTLEPEKPVAAAVPAPAPAVQATRAPREPSAKPAAKPASAPASAVKPVPDAERPTTVADAALAALPASSSASSSSTSPTSSSSASTSPPADDVRVAQAVSSPASTAAAVAAVADAAASASVDVATAASSAARGGFSWPQATRVRYHLTGNYRGDVQGSAEVEWIRQGDRYQVNVDLVVGPTVAPILRRLATSEGRLTAEGLSPDRYAEQTKALFGKPRTRQVMLGPTELAFEGGKISPRPAGVQDGASQFIQFTWLFGMQPELLRTGQSFEIPLALTRNVDRWRYDVVGEEPLATPFGTLTTFHLKPVRTTRRPSEIAVEMWLAPELRHLPVRIRFEQDTDTWLDLVIAKKPELSG